MGIDKALKKATSSFSWSDVGKASVLTGVGGVAGFLTSAGSSLLGNYLSRDAIRDNSVFLGAQQFDYAKKYALNSPSWNVEGLRAANLNPILAATDGAFASPTVPNIDAPTGELSGHGQNMDVLSAYSAMQNLKMARERTDADVALVEAQKANVKADTRLKKANARNVEQNRGLTGIPAVVSRVLSEFGGFTPAAVSRLLSEVGLTPDVISAIKRGLNPGDTSSKDTPKKPNSPKSDSVKQSHHPADSTFKPHYSEETPLGRFFNSIDREIHRDNYNIDLRKRQLKSYKARSHRRYSP